MCKTCGVLKQCLTNSLQHSVIDFKVTRLHIHVNSPLTLGSNSLAVVSDLSYNS